MKLLVLADTHSQPFPKPVQEALKAVDMIIHVGDFCDVETLDRLRQDKEVKAVYGNMDGLELREQLPRQAVFKCEGVTIGLIHGEGGPDKLVERVKEAFKGQVVDVIIFGHSHMPFNDIVDGVLLFNPGSATDTVRSPFRSYGILEIVGKAVKGKIVKIK
jgi:uncharacterized protein